MNGFDYPYGFSTPAISMDGFQDEYRRDSITTDGSVLTYSSGHSPTEPTSFEDAVTPEDNIGLIHGDMLNCNNLNNNFNAFQRPAPAVNTGPFDFDTFNFNISSSNTSGFPHLSPGAQPDVTLFSPHIPHVDEGYSDGLATFERPTGDFTLFDTTQGPNLGINSTAGFFDDMNQMGGQFENNLDLYADPSMPPLSNFEDLMSGYGTAQ